MKSFAVRMGTLTGHVLAGIACVVVIVTVGALALRFIEWIWP